MDTLHAFSPVQAPMPRRRIFAAYLQETRAECLRYLRSPSFLLPTLLFPAVFFLMFGVVLAGRSTPEAPRFLLASYSTFGVMAPGLFGFGMSLALERDNGLLTLKRALPMPPAAYLAGKMAMAMLMAALITALLQTLGLTLAHVQLQAAQVLRLALVCVAGSVPFCALGLLPSCPGCGSRCRCCRRWWPRRRRCGRATTSTRWRCRRSASIPAAPGRTCCGWPHSPWSSLPSPCAACA